MSQILEISAFHLFFTWYKGTIFKSIFVISFLVLNFVEFWGIASLRVPCQGHVVKSI